jgi:hypothetical protein
MGEGLTSSIGKVGLAKDLVGGGIRGKPRTPLSTELGRVELLTMNDTVMVGLGRTILARGEIRGRGGEGGTEGRHADG